jgi:hypothetical protein
MEEFLIIMGVIILTPLIFLQAVKIWVKDSKFLEEERAERYVQSLIDAKTPKLTKEEQFAVLDGDGFNLRVRQVLKTDRIPFEAYRYLIDIEPDDYFDYLQKNPPPKSMLIDMYEVATIEVEDEIHIIRFFGRAGLEKEMKFSSNVGLLKFIVFYRLTSTSSDYKLKVNESYYSQYLLQ